MKLIGEYDSPFVRRVAVALRLFGHAYDHLPWSVFGDAEKIAAHSPLMRVPVLVLDGGEALIESHAITQYLELTADTSLWPAAMSDHIRALRLASLATGAAEKAVSLVYERLLHDHPSDRWIERCIAQVTAALDELESARSEAAGAFLFGADIGHADIALACVWRFIGEAHADSFEFERWPSIAAHSARCESRPPFTEVVQPFKVTLPKRD